MSGTVSDTPASLEGKQPVESWARIQPPVDRRRGRLQNPQRESSAFDIAQAQAAARAENQAKLWGGRAENRARGRAAHKGRGRTADWDRDRGQSQFREAEVQPRRAGLRRT